MSDETTAARGDWTFVRPSRYQTHDIPGIGGVIKQRPEDFLVEELPQYQPCGEGEHIYLLVQKKGMSTLELVKLLENHFGVTKREIGFAGLKDKQAITRQVFSIHAPGRRPEDFPSISHEKVEVLWADLHTNKLRRGHLAGNRFSIRVRGVKPTDVLAAKRVLDRLEVEGIANRIGEQRFGMLNNNHLIGRAMIMGEHAEAARELLAPNAARPAVNAAARAAYAEGRLPDALDLFPRSAYAERCLIRHLIRGDSLKRAFFAIDFGMLAFYVSAFQSAVFNAIADARVVSGELAALVDGDVGFKHANHAVFSVDEAVAADPTTAERLAKFEISPSGPMWGGGMKAATGRVNEAEVAALLATGATVEKIADFTKKSRNLIAGERRALRVPVIDPEVEGGVDEHGAFVRCAFELPRGSFATAVMREIMKPAEEPVEAPLEDEDLET
ncbi:MAG: tRNA pseudouridine(13) synthase TruD [Phycisphaerales bacterium]